FQLFKQKEIFDKKTHKKLPVEQISLVDPIEILANAAKGVSPFPLPKVPALINHVVLYKSILNDIPTFPITMLQLHTRAVHSELVTLINLFEPSLVQQLRKFTDNKIKINDYHNSIQNTVNEFRILFLSHPQLSDKIIDYLNKSTLSFTQTQIKQLRALVNIYQVPDSIYLNFYGQVGSIKTISYYEVLNSDPDNPSIDVKGKAVFVGFSEQFQPDQKDGFNTVYTNKMSGSEISGVEIIATAFANLFEQQLLKVPTGIQDIGLITLWGVFISVLLRFTPGLYQIPVILLLGSLYSLFVYYSFVTRYYWLPFMIPLLVQLSFASILSFIMQYREVQIERKYIRHAFGYHLPVDVVDEIAKGINHVTAVGEKVHGIVLATDAQQYTQLSEKLNPDELQNLMNKYYEVIFTQVRSHNGIISDVVGDAAMAIWTTPTNEKPEECSINHVIHEHQQACLTALAIKYAIYGFNQSNPNLALPTRMGLDCGEIVMGHVGALDHYEYRAIGDIVNTASRIEGVNKLLDTNIIVSSEVLIGTNNLISRELGCFKLLGKQNEITLHELIAYDAKNVSKNNIEIYDFFKQGLLLFNTGEFH
ncbi:Adenylate cyclase, partial [hydrothermal vent metagenome]